MGSTPNPDEIYDLYRRAIGIGGGRWPLRWRAGAATYAELHSVTLAGEPAVRLSSLTDHPTLFGLPLVRDLDAAHDFFEIEAKPRDVWVMVLRGKTSYQDGVSVTNYPVSPLQDSLNTLRAWPYEDIPNGPRIWTDATQAPIDGLVASEALPKAPTDHTDLVMYVPPTMPIVPLSESPLGFQVKTRRFRREQWRSGGSLMWLWRRVE